MTIISTFDVWQKVREAASFSRRSSLNALWSLRFSDCFRLICLISNQSRVNLTLDSCLHTWGLSRAGPPTAIEVVSYKSTKCWRAELWWMWLLPRLSPPLLSKAISHINKFPGLQWYTQCIMVFRGFFYNSGASDLLTRPDNAHCLHQFSVNLILYPMAIVWIWSSLAF